MGEICTLQPTPYNCDQVWGNIIRIRAMIDAFAAKYRYVIKEPYSENDFYVYYDMLVLPSTAPEADFNIGFISEDACDDYPTMYIWLVYSHESEQFAIVPEDTCEWYSSETTKFAGINDSEITETPNGLAQIRLQSFDKFEPYMLAIFKHMDIPLIESTQIAPEPA